MSKPSLLAVATVPVWPIDDGYSLRVYHLVRALAEHWDITLVAPPHQLAAGDPEPDLADITFRPVTLHGRWTWLPSQFDSDALAVAVDRHLGRRQFDAALLWPGAEFLGFRPGFPPAVADRIDCMALINWREVRRAPWRLRYYRAATAFARYEREMVRRLPAVTAVGPADVLALARLGGRDSVHLVPNGVEVSAPPSPTDESADPTVVFSGVMNYAPNFVAAEWFARSVWPRVRARVPAARYRIAGRRPIERIRALVNEPGIEVTGPVPSMTDELRQAWVAIAPMRSGGGIKNKVLEAWAVGTPVVLTSVAANGLELDDLASEFVADDAAALADRVVDLLEHPTARARAGQAAWELASREHGWGGAARRLTQVINQAVRTVTDSAAVTAHLE